MTWPIVRLRRVTSKIGSGATPRGGGEVYKSSGIPLIRSMNIHFEGFRRKGLVFIDNEEAAQLDHVTVQPDDVLFNITGASIGRVTTAPADMAGARVNQHVCILRTIDALVPQFLAYYMATPAQQAVVDSNQTGGTRQAVTKAMLLEWPVPLPAPKEQRRIVELLEQADGLRRQRTEADALADRILPTLFHKMFADPATNPKGWNKKRLGDVIAETAYGTSNPSSTDGKGLPVLRMNNISSGGQLKLTDLKHVVLEEAEAEKHLLADGDLLFNRTNSKELVGKTGLWRGRFPAVAASYLIRVRLDTSVVVPDYVWAWMSTTYFKQRLFAIARRAVGMANINATELRAMPLLVPAMALQHAFAARLRSLDTLAARREEAAQQLQTLFSTLLHRAFTGELTAKWREAHLKELLVEMEKQSRLLKSPVEE